MPQKKSRIIHGCAFEVLSQLRAKSVDLTVTSPPYDSLRKYAGLPFDKFQGIAQELFRVTKPGGVVVWVVNDATVNGSETGTSFRQALYFKEIGFNLHDTMIYSAHKLPVIHKRYQPRFEYMFVLTRGQPKTFNALLEPCSQAGKMLTGTQRHDLNKLTKLNKLAPVKSHKPRGNIWHYGTVFRKSATNPIAHQHPAIFPEKLAEDHVLSWSNPGDLVLDPFHGAGTTGLVALNHGRRYLGIELNKKYIRLSEKRISEALLKAARPINPVKRQRVAAMRTARPLQELSA